jgi:hypothetical protein
MSSAPTTPSALATLDGVPASDLVGEPPSSIATVEGIATGGPAEPADAVTDRQN